MALNEQIKAALDAAFGPGDAAMQANRQAFVNSIGNPVGSLVAAARAGAIIPNPIFDQDMASTWPTMTQVAKASAPAGCPTDYCGRAQSRDNQAATSFPVTPGKTYFVEAWIDTTQSAHGAHFGLAFLDNAGAGFQWLGPLAPSATPWARYSAVITVPAGAVRAAGWCQIDAFDTFGSVYFTALRVSDGTAAQDAAAAAQATANAASAAATTAQADAASALGQLSDIASDNILTPGEKPRVIQDNSVLVSEQAGIDSQADTFGVSRTGYDTTIAALTSYLATLTVPTAWNSLTGATVIVGATFWAKFEDVYAARTGLLNAIAAKAKQLADAARTDASTALANAATAQSAANAAQTDATSALTTLNDIASDNVLTPGEKPRVIMDDEVILNEQAGIDSQADTFAVSRTAYDAAVSALTSYLVTLTSPTAWNSLLGNTTIVGSTFRQKFLDVYAARQALLNAIAAKAKQLADAAASAASGAQSTADGKNKFSGGAAPHSPAAMNDVWFNSDVTTNCPDDNCKGHTLDAAGTPNVGAYPHRKLWWVHKYSGSVWLDAKGQESIIAADVTAGAITAVAVNADSITTKHLTVLSDRDNLWPNPSSELAPPTGADTGQPEWADRVNAGAGAYSGSWVRQADSGAALHGFWLPCSPGAQFYAEAQGKRVAGTGTGGRLQIKFFSTYGDFGSGLATATSPNVTSGTWGKVAVTSGPAPAGTNAVHIGYWADVGDTVQFDALYARRVVAGDLVDNGTVAPTAGSNWTATQADVWKFGRVVVGHAFYTAAAGATFSSIFTLPAGARPLTTRLFMGEVYDSSANAYYAARFTIDSNGVAAAGRYDDGTSLAPVFTLGGNDYARFSFTFVDGT